MIDASLGEILVTCEKLRWLIANGEQVLKPEKRPVTGVLMMHKRAEIRYEPLGVVAALVSWNYPVLTLLWHRWLKFHNMMGPLIEAIYAGNGIIVKGSEQTAWSAQYNIQVARAALAACGHDTDLVQVRLSMECA
jgi:acyl-CoA reductase-like NAD-dependent aldehyde dehydrogenase